MPRRTRARKRLETWLGHVSTPVFLLGADRVVAWVNDECCRLTGWPVEQLVGQRCDYTSDADPSSVESCTACFCPPPDLADRDSLQVPVDVVCRDGRTEPRLLHFFALRDEDGRLVSTLGLIALIEQPVATTTTSPAQQLHAELAALRSSLRQQYAASSLIGTGPAMKRFQEQIELAGASARSVCLVGEPGVGKEHAARVIHYLGSDSTRSFVPLDCRRMTADQAALTLTRLLEPEDDGSPAAAAIGPGTLYLADVDHLSRDLQARLAEADDDGGFSLRLIVSATRPLEQAVADESLLPELLFRLTAIPITLPPLRERPGDLPALAQHFLERDNRGDDRQLGGFSDSVLEQFQAYRWPGNLDELADVVRESRTGAEQSLVGVADLPFRFRTGLGAQNTSPPRQPPIEPLADVLARVERDLILEALELTRHNKTRAAELLGLTRPKLYRRIEQLGIDDGDD